MFGDSSRYYDLIYGFKDYHREAEFLRILIERVAPGARTLLDVACGTGEHLRYLTGYHAEGLDLNSDFLDIARRKLPEVRFHLADMRDFKLGKTYDVITCLFSSLGYLLEDADVVSALSCFRRHLAPEGVALVEPWFEPAVWERGRVGVQTVEDGDLKVCRMTQSGVEGNCSVFEAHHLVAKNGRIQYFTETHRLRLLTREHLTQLFREAGWDAEYIEGGHAGRGLYVGR